MRRRTMALLAAFVVLFAGIGGRLLYLANQNELAVSNSQATRTQTIAVSRGTIYDRYGEKLVNRDWEIVASVSPSAACMQAVRGAVTEDSQTVFSRLAAGERVVTPLEAWAAPTPGLTQITAPVRYNSEGDACHVIGYINGAGEGVSGVERYCEEQLSAFRGEATVTYEVDALGRVCVDSEDTLQNTLSLCTGGVVLTLDAQIQSIVCELASTYMERGAVVVTDPESGEVLASVSLPLYDPNDIEASLTNAAAPLLDRTLIGYDLGSVFKIVIAAAALENGMSTQTSYVCEGTCEVNGRVFHCHNPLGDGLQTMAEAMANSCNVYFIKLALSLGADAVYDMALRAGFSSSLALTGDYKTACAVLPSLQDLSVDAALANLAIGQGDLLASPVHVAMLLGAVASDGEWREPTLLYGEADVDGVIHRVASTASTKRLFSVRTAKKLQEMLLPVVTSGTGRAAQPVNGTAAGKTGTAQTGWEQDGEEVVQSWFAGYFPAEKPQYVITVLSENGGENGKTASPLFAAITDALYEAGLVSSP